MVEDLLEELEDEEEENEDSYEDYADKEFEAKRELQAEKEGRI